MDFPNNFPSTSYNIKYSKWTLEENKNFEKCLTMEVHWHMDEFNRSHQISQMLGGRRTPEEVKIRYRKLVDDINLIEGGRVLFPEEWYEKNNSHIASTSRIDNQSGTSTKGTQWSPDEHRLFLMGLEVYEKSDWRSISRLMKNRSPTQIASHAQKYHNKTNKATKRSSIHNITTFDVNDVQLLCSKNQVDFQSRDDILNKFASRQPIYKHGSLELFPSKYNAVQQEFHTPDSRDFGFGSVQQQSYTPNDREFGCGSVKQPSYTLDDPREFGSGRVQQPSYTLDDPREFGSGNVQQPSYTLDVPREFGSGSIQQPSYKPDSREFGSGSVQQPSYKPDSREFGSGSVQQPSYKPDSREFGCGSVQQPSYTPDSREFGYGSVQQPSYTPDSREFGSGNVQQPSYTPDCNSRGWFW